MQQITRYLQSSSRKPYGMLMIRKPITRCSGGHIAEQHMETMPFASQLPDQIISIHIITEPGNFSMTFLRRQIGTLQIHADHSSLFSNNLRCINTPTSGMTAQVQDPIPRPQQRVAAVHLL